MQNCTVILENRLAVTCKIKVKVPYDVTSPILDGYLRVMKIRIYKKALYKKVATTIIHSSQKLKRIQMSINR